MACGQICGQNSQHIAVLRWQRMGKNCKTLEFLPVAATFEDKNLGFVEPKIRDCEVGGSNPLAPTITSSH